MSRIMREDWVECELGDLSILELGGDWGKDPNVQDDKYTEAYCIRGSEFRNWEIDKGKTASLRKIKKDSIEKRNLQLNDILVEISGGGPDQPVGRTVVIEHSVLNQFKNKNLVCTNFLRLIRSSGFVDSIYINHYLKYFYSTGKIIRYQSGSNNLRNLKFRYYLTIEIPLAPLPIQRAIVSKIEALFSDLDNGIANLKKAQEQLKIYRQAVLKKAFEGELTKEWRVKTQDLASQGKAESLPTAEHLQKQIKEERQNHSDNLPKGWKWVKLGEVIEKPKYGTSKKCDYKNGKIGVLRIPNISNGFIDDSDLKLADFSDDEIFDFSLIEGDILTIRSNGSVDLVGKCALIKKSDTKYLFAGYLIRLRPLKDFLNSQYLLYLMYSIDLRVQIESFAKSTSGVNNINSGELSNLLIPLCSLTEQTQIVQEIESRLSVCDKVEQSISESLKKAEALRQSILKKAFEGKLLSDAEIKECKKAADYEPASKLLERIKQEKTKQINNRKTKK